MPEGFGAAPLDGQSDVRKDRGTGRSGIGTLPFDFIGTGFSLCLWCSANAQSSAINRIFLSNPT